MARRTYLKDADHEWESTRLSNGDGTHTRICKHDNGHTDKATCSGGKATCTEAAICEMCRGRYGEFVGHVYDATDWSSDEKIAIGIPALSVTEKLMKACTSMTTATTIAIIVARF